MGIITTIARVLVGVLFIISGLIKANDPLGFSYKLEEYFVVFHMEFMSFAALALAVFISVAEIALGAALLLGARIRLVSWSLLLMIVFFTFLTFYSAYFNKVTDCGCFGDALKLTPWTSFWKDIILLVLILIIFFRRKYIYPVISESFATGMSVLALLLSAWFAYYCYSHLPVVDFRPYAIGRNIPEGMKIPEGAKQDKYETKLFYEKDGLIKEFDTKNYPWQDSTWVWKETKNVLVEKGYEPPIHDFKLMDADGVDRTEQIFETQDYHFFLVSYDLSKADRRVQAQINQFAANSASNNIRFIGITGTIPEETEVFRHDVQAAYDFYFCDQTALKTIIRSNPGLVLLKGGTVVEMWHHNDFPDFRDVQKEYLSK